MKTKTNQIVAEVSVNYGPTQRDAVSDKQILSKRFEHVIKVNRERGYELESWQISRVMAGAVLNETIVAVFVRTGTRPSK